MQFFAVALAAFAATVSAMSYDECSVVTVTQTVTYGHTVPVPGTGIPTSAPYPTGEAPPYPIVPSGTAPPAGEGTAAPTGTGVYTPAPPQFTGAASGLKVGGMLAGVGAVAAVFL